MTVILFIIVLAVLVLVHELGHFLSARWFGIDVEEFGFGFPPRAFGIKKGKTLYSINWIPLGGFVKIKGEDDPNASGPGTFSHKPAWVRVIVIGAGVFMNLVLASLLFAIGLTIGMPQPVDSIPADARVRDRKVQIVEVLNDTPAAQAGLQSGDTIVSINGQAFTDIESVQTMVNIAASAVVDFTMTCPGRGID